MTPATAAPVSRPPRWACQAIPGTTKPRTALMPMMTYMPAADRPSLRWSTRNAPNRPNTAPEAPTAPVHQAPKSRAATSAALGGEDSSRYITDPPSALNR